MHTLVGILKENPWPLKKDALELVGVTWLFQHKIKQQPTQNLNVRQLKCYLKFYCKPDPILQKMGGRGERAERERLTSWYCWLQGGLPVAISITVQPTLQMSAELEELTRQQPNKILEEGKLSLKLFTQQSKLYGSTEQMQFNMSKSTT